VSAKRLGAVRAQVVAALLRFGRSRGLLVRVDTDGFQIWQRSLVHTA
jgi:hypothetical protein